MVNLMLQPVFMNLVKGSSDYKMTSDDLYNMWSVASRAKSAIVQGRRLENLSWRLWYTSTIRTKIDMDEKQKLKENRGDRFSDGSNSGELSSTDQYNHHNVVNEENSSSEEQQLRRDSAAVLPSDRPLFTSICTSILAEIQDASFRFGGNGIGTIGLHNFTNIHNYNNFSNISHNHNLHSGYIHSSHATQAHSNNNIVSPPTTRAKSPATTYTNIQPKRKKNVEKFLKKFKSKLEDITEQFDEKLGFTDADEETNNEEELEAQNNQQNQPKEQSISNNSLSPTNTIHNFATDEEGPDSSFYSGEQDFISMSKKTAVVKNQISMISRLLQKGGGESANSLTNRREESSNNPEPIHQIPPPKFLYAASNNNSDSFINNQLELMASNRYERFNTTNSVTIKSPKPSSVEDTQKYTSTSSKRVIDANALSSSLSANKFKLEEEFDSQIVIW